MLPLRSGSDFGWLDTSFSVTETSQIGEVRRAGIQFAASAGFDEVQRGKVALVLTEAASNIIKHAGSGEILVRSFDNGGGGLDLLILDKGPGMRDPERCFRDGYSTAGTPGTGLGAIIRLADELEWFTLPQGGVILNMRMHADPTRSPTMTIDTVQLPKKGETACGDGWAVEGDADRTLILLADGLGHGPQAADAAHQAIRSFRANAQRHPGEILQAIHLALRGTRGAAVAVAELRPSAGKLVFTGLGNIAGTIFAHGGSRSMVSHNGTAGMEMRRIQEFSYDLPTDATVVLHSDGLATSWRLEKYPGLLAKSARTIAGILYRDFQRGRDDVTVLVARPIDGRAP